MTELSIEFWIIVYIKTIRKPNENSEVSYLLQMALLTVEQWSKKEHMLRM